eukprot:TRINITY_DN4109_c0_g1_i1.p1 TRINITY_DN4109_c0_g1~~TRINITY_DN4109_c0_g1_i1.p1  ORF type:complete len:407 (+),score=68.68 TRINITY_DN4109_c0_g1_i1:7-1227(+)
MRRLERVTAPQLQGNTLSDTDLIHLKVICETFAPQIYLHHREKHFPSSCEWYLSRCVLVDGNNKYLPDAISPDVLRRASANSFLRQRRETAAQTQRGFRPKDGKVMAPVYCHVLFPDEPAPNNNWIDIRYWTFYPYNGPVLPGVWSVLEPAGFFGGFHEGDWERVTIRVLHALRVPGDTEPTADMHLFGIFFTAHGWNGQWKPPQRARTRESLGAAVAAAATTAATGVPAASLLPSVPAVYIADDSPDDDSEPRASAAAAATGSASASSASAVTSVDLATHEQVFAARTAHGTYSHSGSQGRGWLPEDQTGRGSVWNTWEAVEIIGWRIDSGKNVASAHHPWAVFEGRWGASVASLRGAGSGSSPRGPLQKPKREAERNTRECFAAAAKICQVCAANVCCTKAPAE